jgi:hypothetical protein
MRKYVSEVFGQLEAPENFAEILELTLRPPEPSVGRVRMWRGQSDIRWPVHSSAFRRLQLDSGSPSESALISYEKRLLKYATHKGYRYVDGRRLSDFDLLARLQHHGAATRLLDATRNALVALYFSAISNPRTDGVLIGLNADFLGGYENEPKEEDYDKVVEGLGKHDHPQTWEPPAITARISAQGSQFLYSSVAISERGSLSIPSQKHALTIIPILSSAKREIVETLSESFDIRHLTLFPDIDGFCYTNRADVRQYDALRW